MFGDNDIKIAGDKPSVDVEKNRTIENNGSFVSKPQIENAKRIGKEVAEIYYSDVSKECENPDNAEMLIQRQLLLSFTATVSFERFIENDTLVGIAQKSFLDYLKSVNPNVYKASSDTGAFSFYYLAFRRDNDVERRIGQTFAMLCSHDGDPIFQELGEALYCWFSSEVKRIVNSAK